MYQRACIPAKLTDGKWPYDHVLRRDFNANELRGGTHRACIQVSIRRFAALNSDDVILLKQSAKGTATAKLDDVDAWMRLVVWDNMDNGDRSSHVDVATDLRCLLPARLQGFRSIDLSAYMTDYDLDLVGVQPGDKLWPHPIQVPTELVPLL